MEYREFDLGAENRDVLAGAWALASETQVRGDESDVMPDGYVEVVVPLSGHVGLGGREQVKPGQAFVVGPLTRPLMLSYSGRIRLCSVRLELGPAARLLGGEPCVVVITGQLNWRHDF